MEHNVTNTPLFCQTNSARLIDLSPALHASYNCPVTRTILFDVDHTLLYTGRAGGLAMARAFHQLHGIQNAFRNIEGTGRTDWSILKRGLQAHDLFDETADFNDTVANFIEAYVDHLATTLREPPEGYVEPGVPELLDALAARDDVRLGLATGNFRRACLLKLEYYELNGHLSEGGFGDDAEDRGDMVTRAIERVATPSANGNTAAGAIERVASSLPASDKSADGDNAVWIIGDTPRDVEAARANNVRCLAVATGDSTVDELRAAGADVALKDLANTEEVLSVLFA